MEPIVSVLGALGSSATKNLIESIMGKSTQMTNEVTVDEAIYLGLLKSRDVLLPRLFQPPNHEAALAEDFETLRYRGLSREEALKVVQLIYIPRILLIKKDYLRKETVLQLDEEQIEKIVDNSLRDYLHANQIDPIEDLNYRVGSIEEGDDIEEMLANI